MKRRQYITAFSLILTLTGLSPVVAEDAGRTSGLERIQPDQRQTESRLRYKLSPAQMDRIQGGLGGTKVNGIALLGSCQSAACPKNGTKLNGIALEGGALEDIELSKTEVVLNRVKGKR